MQTAFKSNNPTQKKKKKKETEKSNSKKKMKTFPKNYKNRIFNDKKGMNSEKEEKGLHTIQGS